VCHARMCCHTSPACRITPIYHLYVLVLVRLVPINRHMPPPVSSDPFNTPWPLSPQETPFGLCGPLPHLYRGSIKSVAWPVRETGRRLVVHEGAAPARVGGVGEDEADTTCVYTCQFHYDFQTMSLRSL
jgi:hypothetical protein